MVSTNCMSLFRHFLHINKELIKRELIPLKCKCHQKKKKIWKKEKIERKERYLYCLVFRMGDIWSTICRAIWFTHHCCYKGFHNFIIWWMISIFHFILFYFSPSDYGCSCNKIRRMRGRCSVHRFSKTELKVNVFSKHSVAARMRWPFPRMMQPNFFGCSTHAAILFEKRSRPRSAQPPLIGASSRAVRPLKSVTWYCPRGKKKSPHLDGCPDL